MHRSILAPSGAARTFHARLIVFVHTPVKQRALQAILQARFRSQRHGGRPRGGFERALEEGRTPF